MLEDKKTEAYFDQFTPNFPPERFRFAIDFLEREGKPEQRLIDIGCGDGATLALIRNETSIEDLTGLDVAATCLERAAAATGCHTLQGSILDPDFVTRHEGQYDYAVLGSVLHHLIGANRRQSRDAARTCVASTLRLLKPGGHLMLFEPTYRPRSVMWAVFWIKQAFGAVVPRRLELGRAWLNIAQPVVSYYNSEQVFEMVESGGARVVESHSTAPSRLGFVIERTAVRAILQRPS